MSVSPLPFFENFDLVVEMTFLLRNFKRMTADRIFLNYSTVWRGHTREREIGGGHAKAAFGNRERRRQSRIIAVVV